jgi:hypothetical protein
MTRLSAHGAKDRTDLQNGDNALVKGGALPYPMWAAEYMLYKTFEVMPLAHVESGG